MVAPFCGTLQRWLAVDTWGDGLRWRLGASVQGGRLRRGRAATCNIGSRRWCATAVHAVAPCDGSLWRWLAVTTHATVACVSGLRLRFVAAACGMGQRLKATAACGDYSCSGGSWWMLAIASHKWFLTTASRTASEKGTVSKNVLRTYAMGQLRQPLMERTRSPVSIRSLSVEQRGSAELTELSNMKRAEWWLRGRREIIKSGGRRSDIGTRRRSGRERELCVVSVNGRRVSRGRRRVFIAATERAFRSGVQNDIFKKLIKHVVR